MIRLCLFDLDQTLVDTAELQQLRESGVHRTDAAYKGEVQAAFRSRKRHIIDEISLLTLGLTIDDLKFGIFTRSPRRYVDAILEVAYPLIRWDVVVAYEDVQNRKPSGEGIYTAMISVGLNDTDYLPDVVLVGDSDVDIRAAYHAGCHVILLKQAWPNRLERTHWRSMELLPDAIVNNQDQLITAIANIAHRLPDLECLLSDPAQAPVIPRFDEIGRFFPNDHTRHIVYAAGRSFAGYKALDARRGWHGLSQSIQDNKDSTVFPTEWVESIKRFITHHYRYIHALPFDNELVVCAIPPRPGREPRLNHLLDQARASYGPNPRLKRLTLTFDAEILAYRAGVRSHSRDHLSREERFANVRDHLIVAKPGAVRGKRFLVIDDVSTTGATLLYAKKYLAEAGATSIDCFTIAMNISNPLDRQ
jgi:phosphoglycolate phosphatase-like HAD superfamily hydrolase